MTICENIFSYLEELDFVSDEDCPVVWVIQGVHPKKSKHLFMDIFQRHNNERSLFVLKIFTYIYICRFFSSATTQKLCLTNSV